jgi:hypothetical protein
MPDHNMNIYQRLSCCTDLWCAVELRGCAAYQCPAQEKPELLRVKQE